MNIKITTENKIKAELFVMGQFEGEKNLKESISRLAKEDKFTGEFKQTYLFSDEDQPIMLMGLGKKADFNLEKLRKIAGFSARKAVEYKVRSLATTLSQTEMKGADAAKKAQAVTEGLILGAYKFVRYKTETKEKETPKLCNIVLISKDKSAIKGMEKGKLLAETANYVRDLVNTPAADMTPTLLANEAKKVAEENKLKITVFGKKELEQKKMNSIIGVGRGSVQEPKLIVIETNPKAKKKIALVGKGITFDSGGLDIKPWPYMVNMKSDMAGAAAVLGAVRIAAKLKLSVNIVGIMACAENMPGGTAQRPGDIITSYSKKTIEVVNTDAEGRLVLADAVTYAEEQKPEAIIDIATLTGSCIVALGYSAAALICNDENLKKSLKKASAETGELLWELPLLDDFRDAVKGKLADVKNVGNEKAGAGTITGGTFIESFIQKTPWAHIDIGGMGWFIEDKDYVPEGGTGFGVRLLASLAENWK